MREKMTVRDVEELLRSLPYPEFASRMNPDSRHGVPCLPWFTGFKMAFDDFPNVVQRSSDEIVEIDPSLYSWCGQWIVQDETGQWYYANVPCGGGPFQRGEAFDVGTPDLRIREGATVEQLEQMCIEGYWRLMSVVVKHRAI